MASGGDVYKPCREMIDMSRYTFLYGYMRLRVLEARHARLRPAQELAGRAWH